MAGIFNLFGGTTHAAKQQSLFGPNDSAIKSTAKPAIFGNAVTAPGKNVLLTPAKSKGLSMRSRSELNVVQTHGNGEKSPRKKSPNKALAKRYLNSTECVSKPLSPRMKDKCSKMEAVRSKQLKAASTRTFKDSSDEEKQVDEIVFKKPFTPPAPSSRLANGYPPPEKLAYYYDEKKYFDCVIDSLDREFIDFVRMTNAPIKPYEDDGYKSDPELITDIATPISDIADNASLDNYFVKDPTMELPELSEDDDDFLD